MATIKNIKASGLKVHFIDAEEECKQGAVVFSYYGDAYIFADDGSMAEYLLETEPRLYQDLQEGYARIEAIEE